MLITPTEYRMPSGERLLIRSAGPKDAAKLCRHRRITSGETRFLNRYPEECTSDTEAESRELDALARHPSGFSVSAFSGGNLIADLGVMQLSGLVKLRHRAELGISIQKAYCGQGLGGFMLDTALLQAEKNGFIQVELGVYADNSRAIRLYESRGFIRYGVLPRAFWLKDGGFCDEILMIKQLTSGE